MKYTEHMTGSSITGMKKVDFNVGKWEYITYSSSSLRTLVDFSDWDDRNKLRRFKKDVAVEAMYYTKLGELIQ